MEHKAHTEQHPTARRIALHVLGASVSTVLLALPFALVGAGAWGLFVDAWMNQGFAPNLMAMGLHVGFGCAMWGLVYSVYAGFRRRSRTRAKLALARARGTVMVETLIILLPFLLLTSGIAQLSMLNIAGMLSDLAAFQAARSVWIWHPETEIGRKSVNTQQVETRAKVAAAMVLAPSAPANFNMALLSGASVPNEASEARGAMVAAFMTGPIPGSVGKTLGGVFSLSTPGGVLTSSEDLSYDYAFDTSSLQARAAVKFTNAYNAVDNGDFSIRTGADMGVNLSYRYTLLFPWFGWIFGERWGFADVYYYNFKRTYTLPRQARMN